MYTSTLHDRLIASIYSQCHCHRCTSIATDREATMATLDTGSSLVPPAPALRIDEVGSLWP